MKRIKQISERQALCKLALNNPKKAADKLRILALGLENCRNTSDTIRALCEIFSVSERTVFRDLIK